MKAGIPLTSAFQGGAIATYGATYDRRYVIGATGQINYHFILRLKLTLLYRRSGVAGTFITYQFGGPPSPAIEGIDRTTINDWQVPFLAKWEPGTRAIRPFIDGGVAYRHLSGQNTTQFYSTLGGASFSTQSSPVTNSPNMAGATLGGGVVAKLAIIHVWPEIRYTHWVSPPYVGIYMFRQMSANQVDVLVGFTF